MPDPKFTGITFSPVTEFIEKTRKLRDLYGSSFILSYLSQAVCIAAQYDHTVVSPAKVDVTMGTPDVIIIRGNFSKNSAEDAFFNAWGTLMDACQEWVVDNCEDWIEGAYDRWVEREQWRRKEPRTLPWDRDWKLWKSHAWELFHVQGESIPEVLDKLAVIEEEERNWVGVNWIGESSTLSGADAIAWPGLGRNIPPKQQSMSDTDKQMQAFFDRLKEAIGITVLSDDLSEHEGTEEKRLRRLSTRYDIVPQGREVSGHPDHAVFRQELADKLGEAIVTKREHLSIPELTKRLSTLKAIAKPLKITFPASFRDVNLWKTEHPMGWFRGDGDQAGQHIRQITAGYDDKVATTNLHRFSSKMREWGQWLQTAFEEPQDQKPRGLGRIVFAGGDDFLGVFYADPSPEKAVDWLCSFKEDVWHKGKNGQADRKPLTPSIGFVWGPRPRCPSGIFCSIVKWLSVGLRMRDAIAFVFAFCLVAAPIWIGSALGGCCPKLSEATVIPTARVIGPLFIRMWRL